MILSFAVDGGTNYLDNTETQINGNICNKLKLSKKILTFVLSSDENGRIGRFLMLKQMIENKLPIKIIS